MNGLVLAAAVAALGSQELAPASCGIRETLWVEHYVAALYLPPEAPPAAALRDPLRPKALRIEILDQRFMPRDIPRKWRGALKKQLGRETYARLRKAYRALERGDRVSVEYQPGPGVRVQINDELVASAPDHGLIDALLETWADGDPLPERLKRVMARNRCF